MSEAHSNATEPEAGARIVRQDFALRSRFDRQRVLTQAWQVLGELELVSNDHPLVATAQAIDSELEALKKIPQDQRDDTRLEKIDAAHAAIEAEMREFAADVSKEALHRTLPELVRSDRSAVLDFLDLLLALEEDERDRSATRASTTGYVIALLCMDEGEQSGTIDPISLSPRLFYLCERAGDEAPPNASEVATALLSALDHLDRGAREVDAVDILQQYRREIGAHFFVPELLRAFVAYRSAELMRASPHHASTRSNTTDAQAGRSNEGPASPFDTPVVGKLAAALRRRMAGEDPELSSIDRVAWCIDLDFPSAEERKALQSPAIGSREDIPGTTMLVGLLCRSAEVIADELEPIGVSFDQLTEDWVKELNGALKKQSDQLLASDYKRACALSELRTKFLLTALSDASREQRVREPQAPRPASADDVEERRDFRKEARALASKAVEKPGDAAESREEAKGGGGLRRIIQSYPREIRIKMAAAAAMVALFLGFLLVTTWPTGELQRLDAAWLSSVSPHLVAGKRNGAGTGEAFVGEVGASWRALAASDQESVALTIVEGIQATGLRNVMVYDDLGELRIQALGESGARVVLGN